MANIAEQIVDMLVKAGVKRIYAVTGDSLNKINDAVRKDGRIQWIHVRHEETGAFAAGAEAQLHGDLACCAGSSGPGHVHLINGLYDAHRSGAPVLAIASTIISGEFGTTYFQETDTIRLQLLQPISDYTGSTPPHATGGYTNRSLPQRSQCHRYPRRFDRRKPGQYSFFRDQLSDSSPHLSIGYRITGAGRSVEQQ